MGNYAREISQKENDERLILIDLHNGRCPVCNCTYLTRIEDERIVRGFDEDERHVRDFDEDERHVRDFDEDERHIRDFDEDERYVRGFEQGIHIFLCDKCGVVARKNVNYMPVKPNVYFYKYNKPDDIKE